MVAVFSFLNYQNSIIACFNIRKYFNSIISTKTAKNEITCFHGLRVIALLIIVAYHSIMTKIYKIQPNTPLHDDVFRVNRFIQLQLTNGVVDIFFVIGAILVTRSVLGELRKWVFYLEFIYSICLFDFCSHFPFLEEPTITSKVSSWDIFALCHLFWWFLFSVDHYPAYPKKRTRVTTSHANIGGKMFWWFKMCSLIQAKITWWVLHHM